MALNLQTSMSREEGEWSSPSPTLNIIPLPAIQVIPGHDDPVNTTESQSAMSSILSLQVDSQSTLSTTVKVDAIVESSPEPVEYGVNIVSCDDQTGVSPQEENNGEFSTPLRAVLRVGQEDYLPSERMLVSLLQSSQETRRW
jgi:hypothetical protein